MSPKGVKFVDLQRQFITLSEPIEKSVRYVMESGRYVGGEQVVKFEREFSDYLGTRFGVGVGSGSDALIIALKSLGIVFQSIYNYFLMSVGRGNNKYGFCPTIFYCFMRVIKKFYRVC